MASGLLVIWPYGRSQIWDYSTDPDLPLPIILLGLGLKVREVFHNKMPLPIIVLGLGLKVHFTRILL